MQILWSFSWLQGWLAAHVPGFRPPDGICNSGYHQSPLVLSLGPLTKRYRTFQGCLLPIWDLWNFERFGESPQCEPKQAACVGKCLEELCARCTDWVGLVNSVSQVNGDIRFGSLLCWASWVEREFNKGAMAPARTSVPRERCFNPCSSSYFPEVSQFSSLR